MSVADRGREKGGLEVGWIVVFLQQGLAVEAGGGYGRRGGGCGGRGVPDTLTSRPEDMERCAGFEHYAL